MMQFFTARPSFFLFLYFASSSLASAAPVADGEEGEAKKSSPWTAHFALQTDWHLSRESAEKGRALSGVTYLEGTIRHTFLEFGARLEDKHRPLPGRELEKGWGLPHFFGKARYAGLELTLGDIYEQFGSGMLLRTYEDRYLGLDNALRGARLTYSYRDVLRLKSLVGQQRNFFDRGSRLFHRERGYLAGGDVELNLAHLFPSLQRQGLALQLGAGLLYKHEDQELIARVTGGRIRYLVQPEAVVAWAGRGALTVKELSLNAEYARKGSDPNATNGYIFRPGSSAMLTASYLLGRSSLFLGARRSENFDFRSARQAELNALRVNFLQPFTKQQTYMLAAFYPYATQAGGEWTFQGELSTSLLDKPSPAKRRRRTDLKLYASLAMELKKDWIPGVSRDTPLAPALMGTDGYTSRFFGMDRMLFREVGLEVSRRVSPTYSFVASYVNQAYNERLIEGHATRGDIIYSNIFIYDGRHKLSPTLSLRTELQYLQTRQAEGDWLYVATEWSLLPHFVFSLSDLWNHGDTREHYYMLAATGSWAKHTLRLSYGRTLAGINCSGGICRVMPETHGIYLGYHLNL